MLDESSCTSGFRRRSHQTNQDDHPGSQVARQTARPQRSAECPPDVVCDRACHAKQSAHPHLCGGHVVERDRYTGNHAQYGCKTGRPLPEDTQHQRRKKPAAASENAAETRKQNVCRLERRHVKAAASATTSNGALDTPTRVAVDALGLIILIVNVSCDSALAIVSSSPSAVERRLPDRPPPPDPDDIRQTGNLRRSEHRCHHRWRSRRAARYRPVDVCD